jgi:hypothetical protein
MNKKCGKTKKKKEDLLNTMHYFMQYVNVIMEDSVGEKDKGLWPENCYKFGTKQKCLLPVFR